MVLLHGLGNLCCVSYDSTLVLSSRIVVKGACGTPSFSQGHVELGYYRFGIRDQGIWNVRNDMPRFSIVVGRVLAEARKLRWQRDEFSLL
jgi:hypothetical protein